MTVIGLAGMLGGLGLLIALAFRGWSVLLLAPIAALVAALFSREPLPPASAPTREDKHTEATPDTEGGEMPPEPVAAKAVKGVIPLPAKKR